MKQAHRNRHCGFSLLEVLVAFVIVALVVTALFRLFGGALGNASAADEWTRALLVAQSRLALAASVEPLREATDALASYPIEQSRSGAPTVLLTTANGKKIHLHSRYDPVDEAKKLIGKYFAPLKFLYT